MEGVGWIATIIIGILAGWIAEKVMSRDHGLFTNLLVGLIGAVVGRFIAMSIFGVTYSGWIESLIVSTIGAIVLLFLWGMIRGRKTT
ncbi:GlsB/YeaQ/YmgE family stress response membrane protein [Terrihabitans sp. B22-R8]|uniref:GlsB/YeaQ/YmgE family stress response membrane protein n=1 Tax=Terrihabitans sp. B22-R8 TaxID=3425128 RepID=UPI00403D0720